MIAPIPKLISEDLLLELRDHLLAASRWYSKDEPSVVQWGDQLQKSLFANPGHALASMGMLAHLTGDVEKAEDYFARAAIKNADPQLLLDLKATTYSNLGFATRALEVMMEFVRTMYIPFPTGPIMTIGVGGFRLAGAMIEEAEKHGVELGEEFDSVKRLSEGLKDSPFSDHEFATVLDVAGEVLRSRKLFWMGPYPAADFDEFTEWASVRFEVDATPEEASEMNRELDDLVIERGLHAIPITAGFVGTRVDDWLANLRAGAVQ